MFSSMFQSAGFSPNTSCRVSIVATWCCTEYISERTKHINSGCDDIVPIKERAPNEIKEHGCLSSAKLGVKGVRQGIRLGSFAFVAPPPATTILLVTYVIFVTYTSNSNPCNKSCKRLTSELWKILTLWHYTKCHHFICLRSDDSECCSRHRNSKRFDRLETTRGVSRRTLGLIC